jgi:hypothetical protein
LTTGKQASIFHEWKLQPPRFKRISSRQITFILLGSRQVECDKPARIGIIKKAHAQWVDKRARDMFSAKVGSVLCLNVKTNSQMKLEISLGSADINPLNALVLWDNGGIEYRNFKSLQILEDH